jgi:hypothetical protein
VLFCKKSILKKLRSGSFALNLLSEVDQDAVNLTPDVQQIAQEISKRVVFPS